MKRLMMAAVALLLGLAPARAAVVWDAVADFSLASNPNGPWSYGYSFTGGSFTPLTETLPTVAGVPGLSAWYAPFPGTAPLIGANNTGAEFAFTGGPMIPDAALFLVPNFNMTTLLAFTAPMSGVYAYAFDFFEMGSGRAGLSAFANSFALLNPTDMNGNLSIDGSVTLAAGDVVTIGIGQDSFGFGGLAPTGLRATFTLNDPGPGPGPIAVPLPASLGLLALGLGMLGAVRRRPA